jgi:hypothetical protein
VVHLLAAVVLTAEAKVEAKAVVRAWSAVAVLRLTKLIILHTILWRMHHLLFAAHHNVLAHRRRHGEL